jgi:hypothetical protein
VGLRRIPVLLLVLLGVLVLAPPAPAAVQGVARTDPREVTGLSLAGDAVVWGDLSAYRLGRPRTWTVRLARPGQRPRVRFTARMPSLQGASLAASATHLAVMPARQLGSRAAWRLLAGPLEGPLTVLNDSLASQGELEWSGGRLAAGEFSQGNALITVRDAASGFVPRELSRDGNVVGSRIAGGRIAIATLISAPGADGDVRDVRIDVRRVDDGALEYSVTARNTVIFDFDLQDDGKVAWVEAGYLGADNSARGKLFWASPAEPVPHALAADVAARTLRVRLAGDRVVFGRVVGGWTGQAIVQPWVTDLAGVARPVWFPLPVPAGSDFDGSRLALAAAGCVWMGDVAGRRAGPPSGTCPRAVTGVGLRRISPSGSRYAYGIHCLMAPRAGCRGQARLEAATRRSGPRRIVGTRRFHAGPGRAAQVRFRVPRSRLRSLRNRAGSVWLFVSVRSTDSAGLTSTTDSLPFSAQP